MPDLAHCAVQPSPSPYTPPRSRRECAKHLQELSYFESVGRTYEREKHRRSQAVNIMVTYSDVRPLQRGENVRKRTCKQGNG